MSILISFTNYDERTILKKRQTHDAVANSEVSPKEKESEEDAMQGLLWQRILYLLRI
jgi:hypothetical protein